MVTQAIENLATFLKTREVLILDVIDILIVAFIIYQVLRFLRGTHAVQMAVGGGVLVGLFWFSNWADLATVNWILRTFLPYAIFGLIVVFQTEIRKALAHLGKTPLFGFFSAHKTNGVVEEIVLATTTLAARKVGAIIVLEREMGLRSYIETGIALEALVTYDLLINIFTPGTPLHDGAVIVQGQRLAAAACFLPLTVSPELSRTLGSRHRAAIGVTEDTDAMAVVVSEETGTISLVSAGQIRRGFDSRSLKAALIESLQMEASPAAEGVRGEATAPRER